MFMMMIYYIRMPIINFSMGKQFAVMEWNN
jgi:hypothetical protein